MMEVAPAGEITIEANHARLVSVACSAGSAAVAIHGGEKRPLSAGTGIRWDASADEYKTEQTTDKGQPTARENPTRRAQGLGQLVINDVQSGSPVRLNIARYHANVMLEPPVALVQIDQSFYNPFDQQHEGTFVFNLPRGASVSRFAMYVMPEELIEGELIERKQASDIYESIVRRRRDPAVLEQIGANLFKMRVFPIFAHDTKRILLDF